MKMKSKKGESDTVILENVIFIVLNLIFFSALLIFVYSSGQGKLVYEQMYAKQIALFISGAEPEMELLLDITKPLELAGEKDSEKIFVIDQEENLVKVSLSSAGGYSFQYFSDYDVEFEITGNYLLIKIK